MTYEYIVKFAHEDNTKPVDSPERHGAGQIQVTTDDPVSSQDHLVEIARTIGTKNEYTKVAITDIKLMIDEEEINE